MSLVAYHSSQFLPSAIGGHTGGTASASRDGDALGASDGARVGAAVGAVGDRVGASVLSQHCTKRPDGPGQQRPEKPAALHRGWTEQSLS